MTDPIKAAMIRTLMLQIRSQTAAGLVVAGLVVGGAWAFNPPAVIGWWAAAILAAVAARWAVSGGFALKERPDAELARWADLYALAMTAIGAMYGVAFLLFAHPDEPITVAITLAALYSVAAGSTPSCAYHFPAILGAVIPSFSAVLGKMLLTGDFEYILLGSASALYGVTMVGYCGVQARALRDGFRIRFENDELLEQLARERAEAVNARQQAEQANLSKSQFLAAASHDLRQPLYALSLFSASLKSLELDSEGRAIVERIGGSITAMEQLFAGLLDISRLEAGTVEPRVAAMSVDALFDRLSQVYRPIARERGLDLRFRSDGEWIASDAVLVEQVLSNLLSNAIRATASGGVLVAVRRRGATSRLEVWDTGVGIDRDDRSRIFDEFVQLDNPERDRRKGLGLGLSIARRAAALLETAIEVRSRTGKGSCFALTLPAGCRPEPGTIHTEASTTSALPRDRALPVLIVEDDADVRTALQQLFTRWGADHDAVIDAHGALAAIADKRYGLVLSDQRLGGAMDGLSLLREIRRRVTTAPPAMALVTGELDPRFSGAARQEEIPVLAKPVRAEELRALLGLDATGAVAPPGRPILQYAGAEIAPAP